MDEFLFQILHSYSEKDFRSVSSGDLGLESDEEKAEQEKLESEYKELFDCMKEALGDRVTEVRLSSSLKIPSGLPDRKGGCLARNGEGAQHHARQ